MTIPRRRAFAVLGAVLSIAIVAVAALAFWRNLSVSMRNPLSDDVTLAADIVQVASSVAGRIETVAVRENQLVEAGDLLVELDDALYLLAAERRARIWP